MIAYQFVRDNFEELEADFQREYRIDLRDALWGEKPIGGRRLTALINGLSPGCATFRKLKGGSDWGNTEELLATVAELIDATNRLIYQVNSKKGARVWEPLRVPRPYDKKRQSQPSSSDEMLAFFGTMAASGSVRVDNPEAV